MLSGALLALGVHGTLGGRWTLTLPWLLPFGGAELAMDRLAGLMVAIVGGVGLVASIYAVAYDRRGRGAGAYVGFIAAMATVPLAADALTFLVAWELMSLASYFLVVRDRTHDAAGAGWVYAVMTHAGFACLLTGMLLLGHWTGSLRFADWRALAPQLDGGARAAALVLLGVGFAGKAGMIPLHVWLPLAHPAAPSHVSALMSAVMVKLGVYGLVRIALDWLGMPPTELGAAVLLAGTLSAVVGVLYAIVDRDLKRMLAFSTIENVGIILIGLGAAITFRAGALPHLAALALVAALFHTVSHAAFKALLFLGAGAVLHATGTRDMERLGGLARRMPWTSACFLAGSVAIAGLPPLSGFVGEWLTFQALLHNVRLPAPALNVVFGLAIAGLALTAGLAAAAFVKAYGITFLALPRDTVAERAHEAPRAMLAAMLVLVAVSVTLGVAAPLALAPLRAVAGEIVPGAVAPVQWSALGTLRVAGSFAGLSNAAVAVALVAAMVAILLAFRVAGAARGRRSYETWGCGRIVQTPRMEYTATAFANPFKRVFDFFYRPVKRLDIEAHPESRLFVRRIVYANPTRSVFDDWLYRPALHTLRIATERARLLQSGSANLYLAYILAALVALLVLA